MHKGHTAPVAKLLMVMAWRNLWRRKRRTFITALTVAFGVALSVTFTASGDYSYVNIIDTSAQMGLGHITVQPEGYDKSPTLDKRFPRADDLREKMLATDGVKDAITRIMGQAMIATASNSVGGFFYAVDPAQESAERNFFLKSLDEGEMFASSSGRGVVIGRKLADKLDLTLGKKLVYTLTDVDGQIVSEMARVSGIFRTGASEADGAMILLPIDRVRKTIGFKPHEATIIAGFVEDQRYAREMRDRLAGKFSAEKRDFRYWGQTQSDVAGLIAMDKSTNYLFQLFVGLLVAAGILNTILMSVLERTREFGIMMAIGLSPGRLFSLVMAESVYVGLLGLVMGIVLFMPWYLYMLKIGIDFGNWIPEGYDAGGVPVDLLMKFRFYKESVLAILSGVFALTLAAGLYPAWKSGRTPPVESIKEI